MSLIGDLPVRQITGEVAETFRNRLKNLLTMRGKRIYAGMSPLQALTTADRLRAALQEPGETIPWGKLSLSRERAEALAVPNSMKTANKYLTVMTSWGSWMEKGEQRSAWLHRGRCPFAGVSYPKSAVQKESRLAGRNRMSFPKADLCRMLQGTLFLDPPSALPSTDPEVRLRQAKFWSILIALYTGMRLSEIAMLQARDFCTENGVEIISLVSDATRSFKTEAGDRKIPLHPDLLKLGLHDFARRAKPSRTTRPLTGMKDSPRQKGANISKWFTRWRRDLGIESARTTFHSFRQYASGLDTLTSRSRSALPVTHGWEPWVGAGRVWREHVDAFLRQRGSQRDYCQQRGIMPRELRKWRTRFYGPVRQRSASEPGAAPAEAGISEFSYAGPSGHNVVSADLTAPTPVIRRRWTDEQKRQLVWDGLNSGQPLARYARRQGIHASVIHRWLRAFARPMLTAPQAEPPATFAAVRIAEPAEAQAIMLPAVPPPAHPVPVGQIEIELHGGRRIRVGQDVDINLLRRLIVALETST